MNRGRRLYSRYHIGIAFESYPPCLLPPAKKKLKVNSKTKVVLRYGRQSFYGLFCKEKNMSKTMVTMLVCVVGMILGASVTAWGAPIGTAFLYQGRLIDDGQPATGTYSMEFVLFDQDIGGTRLTDQPQAVEVTDGLFEVTIDFGGTYFDGRALWLQINIEDPDTGSPVTLLPRQPLHPTPYSRYAATVPIPLHLSGSSSEPILVGDNWGSGSGVHGATSSGTGKGVSGEATAIGNFQNYGGYFTTAGAQGRGVYGYAGPGSHYNYGGYFESEGDYGHGVYGKHILSGHYGRIGSPWEGMFGYSSTAVGVGAQSQTGKAVSGNALDSGDVTNYGGYFIAAGAQGRAVYGEASHASGVNYGIYGKTNSGNGYAGYFEGRGYFSSDVGIGTLYPTHSLHVVNDVETNVLRLQGPGDYGSQGKLNFGDGDYVYLYEDTDDTLEIHADDGIALTGGNVGIGTIAPEQKLHVVGISKFEIGGGSISFSTPGGWPGVIAYSPNDHRRDIQYYNDFMCITMSDSSSAPSSTNGIRIYEDGTVAVKVLQITGGADLSEQFNVRPTQEDVSLSAGMVVCIDPDNPGDLKIAAQAYDRTVAGVISGAADVKPGMVMGQHGTDADGDHPVALTGRVYCLADASNNAIQPGDLLTTSNTPGYAMKVTNHTQAQGAILGKAMQKLEKGQKGLILILVTLQ
jgi:hypothetical protein